MKIEDYLHRKPVRRWLEQVAWAGLGAGHQLAEALGTPTDGKPGLADSVAMASDIIKDLQSRGLVERGGYEPGFTMRVAGVGGGPSRGAYAVEYCWMPTKAGMAGLLKILDPNWQPPNKG